MKFVLSALISDAQGKCGDIVASHNRYGLFFRERRDTPANNSPYWHTIRNQSELLSAQWSALLESERKAWNEGCRLFIRRDSMGQQYYQSGMNFFCGTNMNRFLCGDPTITTPPLPTYVPLFESLSIIATTAPDSKILNFTPAISPAHKVKLWLTTGLSAGITRAFHQFRLLTLLDDSFLSGDDIEPIYSARTWTPGPTGNKLFVKAIFIDRASGLAGQPIFSSTIIV